MKRLVSSSLAVLAAATVLAAPALGEPVRKTELVNASGQPVDSLRLSYNFDAVWVVDNQNLLWRDESRDYYLVSLNGTCEQLDSRGRKFNFHPADPVRLDSYKTYEVRPAAGPHCAVEKIELLNDVRAVAVRASAQHRAW